MANPRLPLYHLCFLLRPAGGHRSIPHVTTQNPLVCLKFNYELLIIMIILCFNYIWCRTSCDLWIARVLCRPHLCYAFLIPKNSATWNKTHVPWKVKIKIIKSADGYFWMEKCGWIPMHWKFLVSKSNNKEIFERPIKILKILAYQKLKTLTSVFKVWKDFKKIISMVLKKM